MVHFLTFTNIKIYNAMKYFYTLMMAFLLPYLAIAQQTVSYSVNPPTFNETESITVTFTLNETNFSIKPNTQIACSVC